MLSIIFMQIFQSSRVNRLKQMIFLCLFWVYSLLTNINHLDAALLSTNIYVLWN